MTLNAYIFPFEGLLYIGLKLLTAIRHKWETCRWSLKSRKHQRRVQHTWSQFGYRY